ncbi:MAG: phosphopantetheine-binding protein [Thermoanaerobaculia bacterium]
MRIDAVSEQVHVILRAHVGGVELRPDLPLGGSGLGLDSIALVEVLVDCEKEFGVTIADEILDQPSFTVGFLVERIEVLLGA